MQQWNVPVPEYIYSNSPAAGEMHNQPYQTEMARRNDRIDFTFSSGALQPSMPLQQHHPSTLPPPMSASQQPPNGPAPQQQAPAPAPAPGGRQRKRPAPNAAPSPRQGTAPPPVAAAKGQGPAHTPPTPQSAPAQPQASVDDAHASTTAPPPAKKSRTNTPWTPEEEQLLKELREAGKSWAEIATYFPNRTEGSVKKHWYKDMHHASFCEDESQALLIAIKEYDSNRWKVIGQKVGKPAKACEQYAKEHFPELFGNAKCR